MKTREAQRMKDGKTSVEMEDCPCSGKNMSNLAAPWILLILSDREGVHGYEITKIIRDHIESLGIGMNMTGLYRHLNMLEKRGMLVSEWDTGGKGPARRKYSLTDQGRECLWRWMNTLSTQAMLIGKFFDHARTVFPTGHLPRIEMPDLTATPAADPES